MTYPTITTADLWLPGDALGGAVLAGWPGPVLDSAAERVASAWPWPTIVVTEMHSPRPNMRHAVAASLCLACTRPEVRDRLRRVLAAGEPSYDIGSFIDAEIAGTITPDEAAGLMHCSAVRVEAGLGVVLAVVDESSTFAPDTLTAEDSGAIRVTGGLLLPYPDGARLLVTP